jgi:hypothetical protein
MTRYTIATRNETTTTLTEEAIEAFRQRLRGPLLTSVPGPGREGMRSSTLFGYTRR